VRCLCSESVWRNFVLELLDWSRPDFMGEMPIFCLIVALHNTKLRCESRVWIFGVLLENPDFLHKGPKKAKKNYACKSLIY
jgi:hypothetical protein